MTTNKPPDHRTRSLITRNHVLDVAVEVLIEHGYAGASTLRIQQKADMSRGRLLHQYPQRDRLLVAAAQHLAQRQVVSAEQEHEWPRDRRSRIVAAVQAMWDRYHDETGYFWAATELWLAARHNAALAEAITPGEREVGREIRRSIDRFFGPDVVGHESYPATTDLINTSMRGVALTYAFDQRDHRADPHLAAWTDLALERLE